MGTVYLARRDDEQYERLVAVKILRSGLEAPRPPTASCAERQILARLEHPNIARLYDGGSTEDGRPYLVMELVEGLPVDAYCDQHRLTIDQRLRPLPADLRAPSSTPTRTCSSTATSSRPTSW